MERVSHDFPRDLQALIKGTLNPWTAESPLIPLANFEGHLLELRKMFCQVQDILSAAQEKTEPEAELQDVVKKNIETIDLILSTAGKLEAELVNMNCGVFQRDPEHAKTAEAERKEAELAGLDRRQIVTRS
jgi:hypothetical protein